VASIQVSTRSDPKTSVGFPLHQAKVPFVSLLVDGSPAELVSAITLMPSFISVSTAQAGEVLHMFIVCNLLVGAQWIFGGKAPPLPPPPSPSNCLCTITWMALVMEGLKRKCYPTLYKAGYGSEFRPIACLAQSGISAFIFLGVKLKYQ